MYLIMIVRIVTNDPTKFITKLHQEEGIQGTKRGMGMNMLKMHDVHMYRKVIRK